MKPGFHPPHFKTENKEFFSLFILGADFQGDLGAVLVGLSLTSHPLSAAGTWLWSREGLGYLAPLFWEQPLAPVCGLEPPPL